MNDGEHKSTPGLKDRIALGKFHLSASVVMAIVVIAMEAAIAGVFLSQVDIGLDVAPDTSPPDTQVLYPASCQNTTTQTPPTNNARSLLVYLVIFIFAQFFQLYLVLDALLQQNTIQIIMHVVFVAACFAYSIVQYVQIKGLLVTCQHVVAYKLTSTLDFSQADCNPGCQLFNVISPMVAVNIAVQALFVFAFAYLAKQFYVRIGWEIIKKISAEPEKQVLYRMFHFFIMFLKLDLFFFIAFAIQFLYLVLKSSDPEFALTIVAILIAIPIVVGAYYAVCYENKPGSIAWAFVLVCIAAYYLFKIVRIYSSDQKAKYVGSGQFLTLFAAIGLFVTIGSFFTTIMCVLNFNKGLKDYLTGKTTTHKEKITLDD